VTKETGKEQLASLHGETSAISHPVLSPTVRYNALFKDYRWVFPRLLSESQPSSDRLISVLPLIEELTLWSWCQLL